MWKKGGAVRQIYVFLPSDRQLWELGYDQAADFSIVFFSKCEDRLCSALIGTAPMRGKARFSG